MAKVKIQGHASGTGILTVTAPNTSTDRTITLPDSTGTLATTADSVGGANGVDFNDTVKARFGTGDDLEIYHDGSQSYIKNSGTGQLRIAADAMLFSNAAVSENLMFGAANGAVTLYHNGSEKLATTATGIAVTGGVAIGGTGTANTLDDYEYGTWTPTFHLNHIGSHTLNYANYVKVGRLVTINMYVYNFGSIGGTGISFGITSLPFSQNVQALGVVTATHTDFHNSYGHAVARLYNGVAYIEQTKDAASSHWLDYSAFNANSHVQMSIAYETSV